MKPLRDALSKGPQLGFAVMFGGSGIIECAGRDWDWIWIDGQHGLFDDAGMYEAVRACDAIGKPVVVRVPSLEFGAIGRALDTAAAGLMVPMIENAEQARAAVHAAKFPPRGGRSFGGRRAIDRLGRLYCENPDQEPFLLCQIENLKGLENAEAIAAVQGVDALFFGADDMALNMNRSFAQPLPDDFFDETMAKIAQAAQKHRKYIGGVFVTPAKIKKAVTFGYQLIVGSADIVLIAQGSREAAQNCRKYI